MADNATVTHTHKFLPSTDSPRNVSENKQLEQKHTKLSNYHKKERLKKKKKTRKCITIIHHIQTNKPKDVNNPQQRHQPPSFRDAEHKCR